MKKIKLLFAVCLVPLALHAAWADDAADIARAAKRNSAGTITVTSSRQKSDTGSMVPSSTISRQAVTSPKATDANVRERSTSPRDGTVISIDQSRGIQSSQSVAARSAASSARTAVSPRVSDRSARQATVIPTTTAARSTVSAPARPTSIGRSAVAPVRGATVSKTGTTTPQRKASSATISRAATQATDIIGATGKDYKKCREVYYSCMDEFCANKDTQLKRCACSARVNDFTGVQKKLSSIEDKMLDFNQRLLTVNMDKEDAEAISKATEGELAYQQDDKSASKKMLDEISKKLKSSTADADLSRNMSAISLSLDTDSAFDNIDSMMGASTTTKTGTALYNAALPICREMAAEVCDESGAAIAESGYQMAVEQDCNTVAKAYDTKQDQALEKIREGGALLEMSRLDIHQQRNTDDILTCKKKMLDMLANSSVCGTDLGKCLDTTGRYIDPSTGEAFLTVNLVDLGSLITRPTGDQKWTSASGNDKFVTFLNSKKKYIEPAMESCQDISDRVWNDFIEDALAQIKLAQDQKLEDMRQSCTSLTTQCLTNTAKSISDFDARALSTFGVSADKTVNEMCAGIKTACTALLETTEGNADWVGGMTEIATDKTYDTIIQTCREVGKACIIQACKSISGNFGLCENIDTSVNRKSIINRTACWNDVVQCVTDAGQDPIDRILKQLSKTPGKNNGHFYKENYSHLTSGPIIRTNDEIGATCNPRAVYDSATGNLVKEPDNCVYDICAKCDEAGYPECATCRLAERIWGNCEFEPTRLLQEATDQNKIKLTTNTGFDTLLSWFAVNTGTSNNLASCRDTSCGIGMTLQIENGTEKCVPTESISSDGKECIVDNQLTIYGKWTNCCPTEYRDTFDNCCGNDNGDPEKTPQYVSGVNINATNSYYRRLGSEKLCLPAGSSNSGFVAGFTGGSYKSGMNYLICVGGTISYPDPVSASEFPKGQTVKCSGNFIVVNKNTGTYVGPKFTEGLVTGDPVPSSLFYPGNTYNIQQGGVCYLNPDATDDKKMWGIITGDTWGSSESCNKVPGYPKNSKNGTETNSNLMIDYSKKAK